MQAVHGHCCGFEEARFRHHPPDPVLELRVRVEQGPDELHSILFEVYNIAMMMRTYYIRAPAFKPANSNLVLYLSSLDLAYEC
jgi:hypothetical protein